MKKRVAWRLAVVLAVLVLGGGGILFQRTCEFTVMRGMSDGPLRAGELLPGRYYLVWGHTAVILGRKGH
jgi:hypothetical protein